MHRTHAEAKGEGLGSAHRTGPDGRFAIQGKGVVFDVTVVSTTSRSAGAKGAPAALQEHEEEQIADAAATTECTYNWNLHCHRRNLEDVGTYEMKSLYVLGNTHFCPAAKKRKQLKKSKKTGLEVSMCSIWLPKSPIWSASIFRHLDSIFENVVLHIKDFTIQNSAKKRKDRTGGEKNGKQSQVWRVIAVKCAGCSGKGRVVGKWSEKKSFAKWPKNGQTLHFKA